MIRTLSFVVAKVIAAAIPLSLFVAVWRWWWHAEVYGHPELSSLVSFMSSVILVVGGVSSIIAACGAIVLVGWIEERVRQ